MKKVLCFSLIVLSVLVMVACSRQSSAQQTAQEGAAAGAAKQPITLKMWDMVGGTEKYPVAAAEFFTREVNKAYPHITLQYESIPWANNTQVFATALAAGEGPDVSNGAGFQSFNFYLMGEILDCGPVIERWKANGTYDKYDKNIIDYFQVDGVQVGLPVGLEPRMFMYRKDWFDAAGLPEPKTWDDMYNAAKLFTDPSKNVYGMAYPSDGVAGNVMFYCWFGSNGSGVWAADGTATDWTNPKNVEVIDFMRKMNDEKLFPPGMSAYQDGEVMQMIQQDRVAMVLKGAGATNIEIAANGGDQRWAVALMPAGPSANGMNGGSCAMNAFMAYKQTDYPEDTLNVLQLWAESVFTLLKDKELGIGYVAPRNDWQADSAYLESIGDPFLRDFIQRGFTRSVHLLVWPAPNVSNWLVMNEINNQWGRIIAQDIITTTTPAMQMLQQRQTRSEALFTELAY